jgi:hypothetical protein
LKNNLSGHKNSRFNLVLSENQQALPFIQKRLFQKNQQ